MTDNKQVVSDRELLELAARAYADPNIRVDYAGGRRWIGVDSELGCDVFVTWNPLTDDGDALRLAVKLQINIEHLQTLSNKPFGVNCWPLGRGDCGYTSEDLRDPFTATRRCITRAAASFAKGEES